MKGGPAGRRRGARGEVGTLGFAAQACRYACFGMPPARGAAHPPTPPSPEPPPPRPRAAAVGSHSRPCSAPVLHSHAGGARAPPSRAGRGRRRKWRRAPVRGSVTVYTPSPSGSPMSLGRPGSAWGGGGREWGTERARGRGARRSAGGGGARPILLRCAAANRGVWAPRRQPQDPTAPAAEGRSPLAPSKTPATAAPRGRPSVRPPAWLCPKAAEGS